MVSSIERAVTRIRHELRERLLEESHDGVVDLLDGLEVIAEEVRGELGRDLRNECERWRLRFEMLAALQAFAEEMNLHGEAA
jgi:Flp pilus assembly protein TadB